MDQGANPPKRSGAASRLIVRTLIVVVVLAVFVAGIVGLVRQRSTASPPKPSHPTQASRTSTTAPSSPDPKAPTTFSGPDGVEASWVVAENRLPGTTSWVIPPTVPAHGIEGFSDHAYATTGDTVKLYVSTPAPSYHVVAYRMGWYGGKGGRQIWTSGAATGGPQPGCPLTPGVNMVSCDNWASTLSFPVTSSFVQGDYLLKLVGSAGQESYVPLTVWSPTSSATYLVVNRTFTEQGWNAYGGYSFYQGTGACPPGSNPYPICNRARVVSFDRPYDTGNGSSDFLGDEFPLVQFCERHGLDVTYVSDATLDAEPQITAQHRVLLSLGHDETWSYPERQAAQTAQTHGMNLVFFGSAAVLRHVRMQASPLGPGREEVNYRDSAEDPLNGHGNPLLVTGNTWSSPPSNWSEDPFVGETYSGYLNGSNAAAFVVYDAPAWPFAGTGLQNGSQLAGVVMSDVDHLGMSAAMPQDLQVLGHSPIPLTKMYTNQGSWGGFSYSDMTYYTDPHSHSGVIDTGTVNWIAAMAPCPATVAGCPAASLQAITGNILKLFGQGPAGVTTPSQPNWSAVQPAGS